MKKRAWIVFSDESGVSLLPQVRRAYAPRGRTPTLRHRLNRKRASMAAALGYHAADAERGPRLCFHLKPGSYDTATLIEVLEQVRGFYAGEPVVLVWDGLAAHWSALLQRGPHLFDLGVIKLGRPPRGRRSPQGWGPTLFPLALPSPHTLGTDPSIPAICPSGRPCYRRTPEPCPRLAPSHDPCHGLPRLPDRPTSPRAG